VLSLPVIPLAYKVVMYCDDGIVSMALSGDDGIMITSVEGAEHPMHGARYKVFVH